MIIASFPGSASHAYDGLSGINDGGNVRVKSPSMNDLMDDPQFRAYMKRVPHLPPALATGQPWQIWLRFDSGPSAGKWSTGLFESYRAVWPVFINHFRALDRDVTITSRRVFFAPPGEWYRVKVRCNVTLKHPKGYRIDTRWRQKFFWDIGLEWCGRCRRPVYWQPLHEGHHALRRQPTIAPDDNLRCTICGIRKVATPAINQMVKMERVDG